MRSSESWPLQGSQKIAIVYLRGRFRDEATSTSGRVGVVKRPLYGSSSPNAIPTRRYARRDEFQVIGEFEERSIRSGAAKSLPRRS